MKKIAITPFIPPIIPALRSLQKFRAGKRTFLTYQKDTHRNGLWVFMAMIFLIVICAIFINAGLQSQQNLLEATSVVQSDEQLKQLSLQQNQQLRILYIIMLVLILGGLWCAWYFILRPLAGSYRELVQNHFLLSDGMNDVDAGQILKLGQELQAAITNNQFVVHYQPIVELDSGKLQGFEALARWQHPERGLLLPKEWLPIAEHLSLASEITCKIMAAVAQDHQRWRSTGLQTYPVNINITEHMLLSGVALEQLKAIIGCVPEERPWIGVEVTESIVFDRAFDVIKDQLQQMSEAGVRIYLDDFGTGFANLAHLRKIPFDALKLDRSFTSQILQDKGMHLIVKSLIELSHGLNKTLICEGVDKPELRQALLKMGCRYSQGFLHYKAMPFDQVCEILPTANNV